MSPNKAQHIQAYRDLITENLMRLHGQLVSLHDAMQHMQTLATQVEVSRQALREQENTP